MELTLKHTLHCLETAIVFPNALGNRLSAQRHPLPGWAADIGCDNWPRALLKYIVSHPAVTCAIPATSQVGHRRQNMAAARGPRSAAGCGVAPAHGSRVLGAVTHMAPCSPDRGHPGGNRWTGPSIWPAADYRSVGRDGMLVWAARWRAPTDRTLRLRAPGAPVASGRGVKGAKHSRASGAAPGTAGSAQTRRMGQSANLGKPVYSHQPARSSSQRHSCRSARFFSRCSSSIT